jgi:hypothetical protein
MNQSCHIDVYLVCESCLLNNGVKYGAKLPPLYGRVMQSLRNMSHDNVMDNDRTDLRQYFHNLHIPNIMPAGVADVLEYLGCMVGRSPMFSVQKQREIQTQFSDVFDMRRIRLLKRRLCKADSDCKMAGTTHVQAQLTTLDFDAIMQCGREGMASNLWYYLCAPKVVSCGTKCN